MKEIEQNLPQRVMELLREHGIIVTIEQAEQIVQSGNPMAEISLLNDLKLKQATMPQVMKGYRIQVQYEPLCEEEMLTKKTIVARIVCNAMKKILTATSND